MLRIRTVVPDFYTDERVVECSIAARMWFVGLLAAADDWGLMEFSPLQLKIRLMPLDDVDPMKLTQEWVKNEVVLLYQAGGKKFLCIKNFYKHQKPSGRVQPIKFPEPWDGYYDQFIGTHYRDDALGIWRHNRPDKSESVQTRPDASRQVPTSPDKSGGKGEERKGKGGNVPPTGGGGDRTRTSKPKGLSPKKYAPGFAAIWDLYPRRERFHAAWEHWKEHNIEAIAPVVMAGLLLWLDSPSWQKKTKIPHLKNWLEGKQWEDEPLTAQDEAAAPSRPGGESGEYAGMTYDSEEVSAE